MKQADLTVSGAACRRTPTQMENFAPYPIIHEKERRFCFGSTTRGFGFGFGLAPALFLAASCTGGADGCRALLPDDTVDKDCLPKAAEMERLCWAAT